ncbi:hypothetical protein THRCLA_04539 [Thraustotheca clavata]|uniref:Uncharacterized protein n=1 Tax=Thraustotheca clavata TaxID=74557 RepID=A0A1V9ZYR3_9STRA|nr:hypothetical protein THRCLA_04539 [Thraustotheca clavata]
MSLVRQSAGLVLSVGIASAIAFPMHLELYAAVAFGVNWLVALLYGIPKQSERFYDLTGSLTFITVSILAAVVHEKKTLDINLLLRSFVASGLVIVWALRLGSFLFWRIKKSGVDDRFDEIKVLPLRFLSAWTLQGLWVFVMLLPVTLLHTTSKIPAGVVTWTDIIGLGAWVIGFALEVIADTQKTAFRAKYTDHSQFISTELWRYSRHPNYFGEILLWIGMMIFSAGQLATTSEILVSILSPLLLTLLLTKVSGIPLLEKKADDKWGNSKDYQEYKNSTSVLIPWFPSARNVSEKTPLKS